MKKTKQVSTTQLNARQSTRINKQIGATFFGMLIVIAALILLGVTGMKVFPAYSEFYSVKSLLRSMNEEPLDKMSRQEIINAFDRRATTSYISTISGKDLKIDKNTTATVVSVNYQVIKPLFANVSVLIDFASTNNDQ